jgi:glycosyltransferase involved in cell wall biosynthesis
MRNGGTEKQLVQLMQHLDRERFQPHLCTLKASSGLLEDMDIPKLILRFRSFTHTSIFSIVVKLAKYIWENDIRIVQTFFQDPFLLGAMSRPFHRAKLIGSFRDLGFWRTPVESRKMRLAYPAFSGFIANSWAVKEHFVQIDGIDRNKIQVIYNGIDCEKVPKATIDDLTARPPLVGIVANCNRAVKRVDDFIRAAALVHQKFPDVHFMVVGDGHLRPQLEALSHSLGLADSLVFTGEVKNPLDMVRNFSIGVISSETEGFCNAILEYMACGVSVVATAAGGNPELMSEGENGFLFPVGDIEILAERIELLIKDSGLLSQMHKANIKRIADKFSLLEMVSSFENHYEKLAY